MIYHDGGLGHFADARARRRHPLRLPLDLGPATSMHAHTRSGRVVKWLLVAVAGVHAALLTFGVIRPEAALCCDRSITRLAAAQALLEAEGFEAALDVLADQGAVGDYALHALVLWIGGGRLWVVQLVQLALLAASLLAVFRMVQHLGCSPEVCRLAVLLYAAIPVNIMIPHFLCSEAFYTPCLVIAIMFLVRAATHDFNATTLGAAGLLLSAGALIRSEILGWLPLLFILILPVARRRLPGKWLSRLVLLAASCLVGPIVWMSFQAVHKGTSPGRPHADSGRAIELRVQEIRRVAGDVTPPSRERDRRVTTLLDEMIHYPGAAARLCVSHIVKLLALPDNLDLFAYLGLYDRTGNRISRTESLGWVAALRSAYREMPVLTAWFLVSIAVFAVFWLFVVWGGCRAMWNSAGTQRLLWLLLLSLPTYYLCLRVIVEGNSRKRSPIDFTLAIFAAVGIEAIASRRRNPSGPPSAAVTPA